MDSDILTVDEAAAILQVPHEVVLNLLVTSELPGRNLGGGQWRTTRRALISFIDGVPIQAGCCGSEMCCSAAAGGRGCC
ncbi:MAG: helix-turn-helix domain-containing protein [Candidatus Hydrogenedentes bacterium]|nr:helix-turn-helix domain-containing protein [Candidatus Hydrogenedentota bacterium]